MTLIISIVSMVFFGSITAYVAKKRGRDPLIWCLVGIVFPLGLFLLLLLPKGEYSTVKNHEEIIALTGCSDLNYPCKEWFYLDVKYQQQGPVMFDYLRKCWKEEKLVPQSFVWSDGMQQWKRISELPDFEDALNSGE